MKLKDTQTEKNLLCAFAGESQARNRYTYFAGAAKKEDYIQIQKVFEETAEQEKEHAKRFFKFLEGGEVEIAAAFPAGMIGTTEQNLAAAANGEKHEWGTLYPSFAKTARAEGFEEAAKTFENISVAEKQHEKRYNGLLKNLREGTVFTKNTSVKWRCLNCGFVHEGKSAPDTCPACLHPKAYFELLAENW
ncbi:MAG: rubrerythrin [bacterium]